MIGRINSTYQVGRMNQIAKRKEDGGIIPTDIAGCKLWLDFADADTLFTDNGVTKVTTDGDLIYRVNDKSGNGYNAVQTTSSNRPQYKPDTKNGLSTIYTAIREYAGMSVASFTLSQPFTIAVVTVLVSNQYGLFAARGSNFQMNSRYITLSDFVINAGSNVIKRHFNNMVTFWHTYIGVFDGLNSGIYLDTTKVVAGNVGAGGITDLVVGGGGNGHFGEILIYDSSLSDIDRGKVETYLNNKWNIY